VTPGQSFFHLVFSTLHLAKALLSIQTWSSGQMTCKIDRLTTGEGIVVMDICGDITGQSVDLLRTLLEQEADTVIIDLKRVLLVDRESVKLLALRETRGVELRNCPAYVREWLTREKADTNALGQRTG
jgi:hypothetical protein